LVLASEVGGLALWGLGPITSPKVPCLLSWRNLCRRSGMMLLQATLGACRVSSMALGILL
jgi:hypothetical protein